MFRQKKRYISFICLPGPQFCKSTQHSGLGLRRENGRFLGLRFLSPRFMLALEQRRDVWILSSGKNTAYLESFPCVTLIYYFRPTFKNNFLVFESWIRTWNGFWFWLFSSPHCKRQSPGCLCGLIVTTSASLCWVGSSVRKQNQGVSFGLPVFILF